jgi:hypothetical protein
LGAPLTTFIIPVGTGALIVDVIANDEDTIRMIKSIASFEAFKCILQALFCPLTS